MSPPTASEKSVTVWNIDPAHSIAEFKVKQMMIAAANGMSLTLAGGAQ